uniref:Melanocortin 2 receptor accessory protein n=1 Tax=Xenopus tropicalis TaxID=8364 RepID=A0A6I8R9E4_XENTR
MIGAAKPSLILTCTQLVISGTSSAHNAMMADTGNVSYTYEDYYDYEDFASFDESEPRANKYSIVIALWVGLAMFVVFLFLILLYMSRTVARSKAPHNTETPNIPIPVICSFKNCKTVLLFLCII